MRTDAQIDKRQVHCPNASTLGYGRWIARFGNFIIFKEANGIRYGRMAGRVHYAPNLDGGAPIRNWLLVVTLGSDLSFVMERWVDPADVITIIDLHNFGGRDIGQFLAYFFGPEFEKHSPDSFRQWASTGTARPE